MTTQAGSNLVRLNLGSNKSSSFTTLNNSTVANYTETKIGTTIRYSGISAGMTSYNLGRGNFPTPPEKQFGLQMNAPALGSAQAAGNVRKGHAVRLEEVLDAIDAKVDLV